MRDIKRATVALGVAGALTLGLVTSSQAMSLPSQAAVKQAAPAQTTDVRWRGGWGWGPAIGFGLAAGALAGAAIASSAWGWGGYYGPYAYDYGYAPAYAYDYGYAPAYAYDYGYAPSYAYYDDGYAPAYGYGWGYGPSYAFASVRPRARVAGSRFVGTRTVYRTGSVGVRNSRFVGARTGMTVRSQPMVSSGRSARVTARMQNRY